MSIFGFIKESKRSRAASENQLRRKTDLPKSPLEEEPDDPQELAKMLEASYKKSVVSDSSLSEDPASRPVLHTIRNGESFQSIARKYYGTADIQRIVAVNGSWTLEDDIFVGQIIHIDRT